MLIVRCDFHSGFQLVAIFDNRTGEIQEKRSQHRAEAEGSYRSLVGQEDRGRNDKRVEGGEGDGLSPGGEHGVDYYARH
jgi:hypothetical protein